MLLSEWHRLRGSFTGAFFDTPTGNRVELRSTLRLAGTKNETSMLSQTAYGFTDNQAFGKRAVVVRAECTHREQLITSLGHDFVFTIHHICPRHA